MKKALIFLGGGVLVLYALLHLILASGPVQKKILGELRAALESKGIEIGIESIEFSFFAPRIYLNRVTVKTNAKSEIQILHPLAVDKIKLEFQPLGLLGQEIVFEEVALFHPKIIVPKADKLYQKVTEQLEKRKRIEVKGSGWPVVFRRLGVVDAQFDVQSGNPSFSIRSRNLTVFFTQAAEGQQNIEARSNHLELRRNEFELSLTQLDGDVDFTDQSIRANKLLVEGPGIKLQWKGAYALPSKTHAGLASFHLAHETKLDLAILNQIQELELSGLKGTLLGSGTLHVGRENYSGTGTVELREVGKNLFELGSWKTSYALNQREIVLSNLAGQWAGGEIESQEVKVGLSQVKMIQGELKTKSINLKKVFESVDLAQVPLFGEVSGSVKLQGKVDNEFVLGIEPHLKISNLLVLNGLEGGDRPENRVLLIPSVSLRAESELTPSGFKIKSRKELLGGSLSLQGAFSKEGGKISFEGEDISLTDLKKIADIPFGGRAKLQGELKTEKKGINIEGSFDISEAMISDLQVGAVKGKVQYRDDLLSFSKLEVRALESARGQGFVDFSPKETAYRFDINLARISLEQALSLFKNAPLPVESPKGGELAGRVVIEGGRDSEGVEVSVEGQARSFEWYGEKWMSSSFGLVYRPEKFKLHRGVLLKRSGSLEVKANFDQKNQQLVFYSSGLRLEDLDHLGVSPLRGEVTGRLVFEGDMSYPRGNGELSISKIRYRDQRVPDARVTLKSAGTTSEYWLQLEKDLLKAHLTRKDQGNKTLSYLKVKCDEADYAPYLSAYLGKDLSPLNGIIASGTWEMEGDFAKPHSIQGISEIKTLKLNFEGRPLVSEGPVKIKINQGGIDVPSFKLSGVESELSARFSLVENESIKAQAEGKIALEFLQPFIPGIDYASGTLDLKIEASGIPKNYNLFGSASLKDGVFRITGMEDEFRSVSAQLSVNPEKVVFEKFQAGLGGGEVSVGGHVEIERFKRFSPDLTLFVSKASLQLQPFLRTQVTGDLRLKGKTTPYQLSGQLRVDEAVLTSLEANERKGPLSDSPSLVFDLRAEANDRLMIKTDVLDAEFSGQFRVVGDDARIGLLGKTEVIRGKLLFKDTPFDLLSGNARFEQADRIFPRFNLSGRSIVREQRGRAYQDYEVNLQVLGNPDDYKIRLTSNPPLVEQDLISLLVLGVTTRGQEGNYFDLGTAIMGQSPIKSKIQSELGVDIKVQSTPGQGPISNTSQANAGGSPTGTGMVPAVKIEKGLSKKTKLSYSNTLDQNQAREIRLEQMLDDSFTLNATAGDRSRNNLQARPGDSFGLDVRYRFSFE